MNSSLSIALSGLQAAQTRMQASAHNLANLGTDGFRRDLVTTQAQPGGGTAATVTQAAEAQGSDALVEDVVGQLAASYAYVANLQVIRTQDRMLGALLDARA